VVCGIHRVAPREGGRHTLESTFVEHFLPLYRSIRQWQHRAKLTLELPLFPNYIFVHMDRRDRMRVLEVPGVLSIVGSGNKPAPLPNSKSNLCAPIFISDRSSRTPISS